MLYIAEENRISRVNVYSEDNLHTIATLPVGGNHTSRTIGFGPDKRLYVAIGSTCNVCHEENDMRAKIFSMNKDGSDLKEFARGLRNSVFFVWHPTTRAMWATEMGRDLLGDDTPPEEINIIAEGKNYGWPTCYGKNIHDTDFDKNTYFRNPCMEPFETPSFIDMQAHSAPLGLAFITNPKWPAEYANDLLVAYHGSWNRTTPTGYKLVRIRLGADGSYQGIEDFITGWFSNEKLYGRPVDLVFGPDGRLYLTDDRAGLVYAIAYAP
jgi:glucose/arabinose dehydrogenase